MVPNAATITTVTTALTAQDTTQNATLCAALAPNAATPCCRNAKHVGRCRQCGDTVLLRQCTSFLTPSSSSR